MTINPTPLHNWGLPIDRMFLAAGPCSAESREQLLDAARRLKGMGISFFRAGLWKPRTHPGSFEGVGLEGLDWLVDVREQTGMAVGIEVATPDHVEACLKHNIDVVWIGARTTPNPFAVQELANALQGSDISVFIKNPVSPDLELWIGAVERIAGACVKKLGLIHRGFSSSRTSIYRNRPVWSIPIEVRFRIPGIPLLCDPSHMCGRADLIFSIAQEALDLLYDGLMIEVHPHPAKALSDSKQQLTPERFKDLVSRLRLKHEAIINAGFQSRMRELRAEIDSVDESLLELLHQRMNIVREMGRLKSHTDISVLQPNRWRTLLKKRMAIGRHEELSGEFVYQLFQLIHEEAIQQQEEAISQTQTADS